MRLLASIKPEDVDSRVLPSSYADYRARLAGRAIIFDDTNKVCLVHVRAHDYYMLPGGGVESGEDILVALTREIMEEVGCPVVVGQQIGAVEVYFDRWQQKQTDICFVAQKSGDCRTASVTDFEHTEGHEVVWADSSAEAVALVQGAIPEEHDGMMIRARDLLFLRQVRHYTSF